MTISASTPLRVVVLLTSIALALLLLLAGSVAAGTAAPVAGDVVTAVVEHKVRPGDTLWSIAAGYTDPGDDVRATIHDIKVANQLESSALGVGQVLVIPVEF